MDTPKLEMHVHLEGAIRPATLLAIAARNGVTLPVSSEQELQDLYRFTDLDSFIQAWIMTTNCLRKGDDFRQVVVDYAAEAAGQGAVYLEAIFSPAERTKRGVGWDQIFSGYLDGAQEAKERFGIEIRFTPDLYRGLDVELAEETARVSVRYRDRGVVGLGIGGNPAAAPLADYDRAIAIAVDGGLGFVPHAGEACDAESVREILSYQPIRIRHGIGAVKDQSLVDEIVGRGVVLDICPTSNLRTRAVTDVDDHPLRQLHAAGVPCTISTDDPAMFDTRLDDEYAIAATLGVTAVDAYRAGLKGMLADDDTKKRLEGLLC